MGVGIEELKKGDVLGRTDKPYPDGAVEVFEIEGRLCAAPLGGGFVLELASLLGWHEFRVVTEEEQRRVAKTYQLVRFSIDDGPKIEGWTNLSRWNGWAMPMFSRENAIKALEAYATPGEWRYDEERKSFFVKDGDNEEEEWTLLGDAPKDLGEVYGLGAGSWTWDDWPLYDEQHDGFEN